MGHEGVEINSTDLKKLVEACKANKDRFEVNKQFVKPISFWKKST